MKFKNIVWLIILIIAAIVIGGMLGAAFDKVQGLSWLNYSKSFGLSADKPAVIDLSVIRLAIGFELKINLAQALLLIAAIFACRKIR